MRFAPWLLCFLSFPAMCQISPEKLLRTENGKWPKVEQSLRKYLAKDSGNAETPYLLSLYFFAKENPRYSLDSAYRYVQRSERLFWKTPVRDREKLKRVPLDSQRLVSLHAGIDSVTFENTKKLNSEAAYQYFIDRHATARQVNAAIELRDEVAFLDALKTNTWQSFQVFLKKYPYSHRRREAETRFEKLLYDDKTRDQRLASFVKFHQQYPKSPHHAEAERNIFEIMTASGSPESFRGFVKRYPSSRWSKIAKDVLYGFRNGETESNFDESWMTDSLRRTETLYDSYWVPVFKSGKYGFMDQEGAEMIAPQIEGISGDYLCGNVTDHFLLTSEGLRARNGAVLWRGSVKEAKDLGSGFILLETDSGKCVMHESGFRVGALSEDGRVVGGHFIGLKKNQKWALFSLTGKLLLPFSFDDVTAFDSLLMFSKNGKRILTTPSRVSVVAEKRDFKEDFVFDDVRRWGSQHYWVRNGVIEGVIGTDLNFIIPLDRQTLRKTSFGFLQGKGDRIFIKGIRQFEGMPYESVTEQAGWIKMVQEKGGSLLYDKGFGRTVTGDSVWFQGQLAFTRTNDSIRAFLPSGHKLSFLRNSFFQFREFRDSSAWLVLEEKKGKAVYDAESGAKLFTMEFDQIEAIANNLFLVTRAGKRGLLAEEGKILVPLEYDAIVPATDHGYSLLKEKKFGWYDAGKNTLIKPQFERNVKPYSAKVQVAYKEKGYGFILPDGKPVGQFEWEDIQYWNDSTAWVKRSFQWMLISIQTGKVRLDRIRSFSTIADGPQEKIFMLRQDNAYGVISSTRGIIVPIQYSDIINLGSREVPLYFTERHIEEAGISVLVYYDHRGKIIRRQAMEADEFEKIYCDN